ncbi:Putative rhamnogalacturonase [Rhizoctonia solani]|uniref:Putative rhamnogalacturonase n=1 Tax=Rhizoctonia solani TaxID=456999 RepID=A0A0K6FQL7_9AGAM|nr:Putative rhamnogalacturonase [Rhizoctonia solani]
MISGHTQTEAHRMGLHGPYLLQFTTGAAPSAEINLTFWDGLSITDWIPTSGRGYVKGKASGASAAFADLVVVGWSNFIAEARAKSNGNYYSPAMRPGTYTMTMYKSELAVATSTVTTTARSTITANIQSQEANPTVVWQIGDFDGTPRGFLNSDMIETMQYVSVLIGSNHGT